VLKKIKLFLQCFSVWKVKPKGDVCRAKVIGAFSFGRRIKGKKVLPGSSNEAIADIVAEGMYLDKIQESDHLIPVVQWEIDRAMDLHFRVYGHEILSHQKFGKYLDTREVARQMVEMMAQWGEDKVIVVAHRLHVWRVVKVLEKLGVEPIISAYQPIQIPFDPESRQWFTRNKLFWIIREIPARLLYLLRGWI
jgi:hypothetical protein